MIVMDTTENLIIFDEKGPMIYAFDLLIEESHSPEIYAYMFSFSTIDDLIHKIQEDEQ